MSVRSRIGIAIGMCAMVSLLGSNVVFAAEAPAADAPSIWKTLGFQLSGAIDTSFTQNFNNPGTNVNSLRIFDTQANSFVPQVAQFMVERPAAAGSATDRVGFRARVNYGPQSRFSRARTNYQFGTDNTELDVHELYGEYIVPVGNGLKIQFGKINTLIGLEVINSWENPNFSRSWTFGLAQAFTETGIRFTYPFASWATMAVGLVNGWDNIEDNNRGKTVTWNLNLTPDPMFGIIFYGGYGAEQSNGNAIFGNAAAGICAIGTTGCDPTAKRLVVGSLITIKPTDSDTLIIEPYYGNESNASGFSKDHNARWNALLLYYTHDFNDHECHSTLRPRLVVGDQVFAHSARAQHRDVRRANDSVLQLHRPHFQWGKHMRQSHFILLSNVGSLRFANTVERFSCFFYFDLTSI